MKQDTHKSLCLSLSARQQRHYLMCEFLPNQQKRLNSSEFFVDRFYKMYKLSPNSRIKIIVRFLKGVWGVLPWVMGDVSYIGYFFTVYVKFDTLTFNEMSFY